MNGTPHRISAQDLLRSSDPLSDEACTSLLCYYEEDGLVDFKESFDTTPTSKSWVELAIDCCAFANAHGGYLVFGVKDKTWEQTGLAEETAAALADIKKVLEKVNRGLAPPITSASSRRFTHEGKQFAVVMVPPSRSHTHVFESDVSWKTPEGKQIPWVRQGAIYVRRSGSNSILTSADFEQLVERRLAHFREKVLEGLVRVVKADPAHEVITVALDSPGTSGRAVTVVDAPASVELLGKSLALRADSLSAKIDFTIALTRDQTDPQIDVRLLYDIYSVRVDTKLNDEQMKWVIYHSLRTESPAFFWLQQVKDSVARDLISEAFGASKFWSKVGILNYAGFYGEQLHRRLYDRLGSMAAEHRIRRFQTKAALFNVLHQSRNQQRDEARATELARTLATKHDSLSERELQKLDCALYAPF